LAEDHAARPHLDLEAHDPSLPVEDPGHGYAEVSGDPAEAALPVPAARPAVSAALARAPFPGLTEVWEDGRLPRIGPDGRTPFSAYRRPFANPEGRPAIAITVGGLGLSRRQTLAAIEELPPEVTLSFVPYANDLQTWVDLARAHGHEVMIELPMEPFDYPNNDTGPYTLLTSLSEGENAQRLNWLLSRATGFFAVTNYQGGRFVTERRAVDPVMAALSARGLGVVQDAATPRSAVPGAASAHRVPFRAADRILDSQPLAEAIDRQLLHLEALALERGSALGAGFGYAATIEQIKSWAETLSYKGYVLAPASALVEQGTPQAPRSTR
jgi:hypothetical protein